MSTPDTQARLSVRVTGIVQGVGFRHFTSTKARALDLVGWVRNEADGSVRVEAEGPREALEALLRAVQRGPSTARVRDVQAEWSDAARRFEKFVVRH